MGHAPQGLGWVGLRRNSAAVKGIHLGKGHPLNRALFLPEHSHCYSHGIGVASSRKPSQVPLGIPTACCPAAFPACSPRLSRGNCPATCPHQWQERVSSTLMTQLASGFWLKIRALQMWFVIETGPRFLTAASAKGGSVAVNPIPQVENGTVTRWGSQSPGPAPGGARASEGGVTACASSRP